MKFLIAATLLCFALVGQIQGGSLRGLTVAIPHQIYGAPVHENEVQIEETRPIEEEIEPTVIDAKEQEKPIVTPLSLEYGPPAAVVSEVKTVPFVDSLPHIDSVVNFGTPSDTYGPPIATVEVIPATPKLDLPYLKPGIPALPKAPVVPIIVKEPSYNNEISTAYLPPVAVKEPVQVNEVINAYLPPVEENPHTPVVEEYQPSEVYGPPTVHVPELPAAPQVHVVPTLLREEVQPPQVVYGTPHIAHHPSIAQVHIAPGFINPHIIDISAPKEQVWLQPNFPIVPEVGTIPIESHKHGYHYNAPTKEFPISVSVPVRHTLVSHPVAVPHHTYGAPHF